ncbi:MAG: Ig-like domain-containing protein, partial [Cyanobacteriota bacterium]|nr:Ig-like domain-containing protein [Cyanobacteriota bacterium]
DDNNGNNDEDALTALDAIADNTSSYSLTVPITNNTGKRATVLGWIDFNGDGTFAANEGISTNVANGETSVNLTWNATNSPGFSNLSVGDSYARLRISTDHLTIADFTGIAIDGEVEDYTISIIAGNTPPIAEDDFITGTPNVIQFINPLENDSDLNDDTLTIVEFNTDNTIGQVERNGEGFRYTPGVGFTGTDTFTYTIRDDDDSIDTATVTITIDPPILPPINPPTTPPSNPPLANNDQVSTTVDQQITIAVLDAEIELESDSSQPIPPELPNATTVQGTAEDDIQLGSEDSDIIRSSSGNDVQFGLESDDNLYGEEGNDTIFGNQQNDFIEGGEGTDLLFGGQDDDTLRGQAGNDTLFGNLGEDWLYGDANNDLILGNQDNDRLRGGEGNDTLHGGRDHDDLRGGEGDDVLSSDEGDDTLVGGLGADTMTGGEGDDLFVVFGNEADNVIEDFQLGQDRIVLSGGLTFAQLELSDGGNGNTNISFNDRSLITVNGVTADSLTSDQFLQNGSDLQFLS